MIERGTGGPPVSFFSELKTRASRPCHYLAALCGLNYMKHVLLIPLVLVLAGALGHGVLRALYWQPYVREMVGAALPALVAGVVALLPALRQRAMGQAAVVQAAHLGLILHMGITLVLGLGVFFVGGMRGPAMQPYACWLIWFFWVTLTGVAAGLIRLVRSTPVGPTNAPTNGPASP
jgi:hypothetical protein